ncbi:serine hydrolase domain-containing protein [Tistrella sp. BH-R2-4]|uniref:Serine hydrolase domain-containing protein n=1 Tax=Tistrella arctica TaxID=3133430 RepID=A0ABU9YM17_9PROT
MQISIRALTFGIAMALATTAAAGDLPTVEPETVGLSRDRLERIDTMLQGRIDAGEFPGAVLLVSRHGKIAHLSALGSLAEGGGPMTEDGIFRIYSMTKPITSVVALSLVEEGKLDLNAPVSRYLPEFSQMTVATGTAGDGTIQTEPAKKAITILDLMRHTAGLTYGFFGTGPAREALKAQNPGNGDKTNRAVAQVLGGLPLEYQPGTTWEYSRATDVLGAVIEVVDGRSLGASMQARVLGPLGMEHTGFSVDDVQAQALIAEPNNDDRMIGNIAVFDPRERRPFETGGGGLVSTAGDYARFMHMLMNGGEHDGARILSPFTVNYMLTDQLDGIAKGKYYLPGSSYGFGLGVAVRRMAGGMSQMGSVGDFFWGGAAGTYMMGDPAEDLFIICMLQSPATGTTIRPMLRNMVYAALNDIQATSGEGPRTAVLQR